MAERYKCYFISKDGSTRSLAGIIASNPASAVEAAVQQFPLGAYRFVEVWHRYDRVLTCNNPAALGR
jgi:hypothetical protein